MQKFVGVKLVNSTPMTLGTYNELQGWDMPKDQDPTTDGYLVEYCDGGKPNHPNFANYISWSPKAIFERNHSEVDSLTFGHAIVAAMHGHKIARAGWNGKNMWVNYSPGYPCLKSADIWTEAVREVADANGGQIAIRPYFNMKTADNAIQPGWVPSQSDMIATDWAIVE